MTSKLKCPVCGKKLNHTNSKYYLFCDNVECELFDVGGDESLWEALEKSEKRSSIWEKKVLDCQMKAFVLNAKLEIAKSALRQINSRLVISPNFVAREALEQIEHKE